MTILCEHEIADTVQEILLSPRDSIGPLDEMKAKDDSPSEPEEEIEID